MRKEAESLRQRDEEEFGKDYISLIPPPQKKIWTSLRVVLQVRA